MLYLIRLVAGTQLTLLVDKGMKEYDIILFSAVEDIHEPSDQLGHEALVGNCLGHAVHGRPSRQLLVRLGHDLGHCL